MASNTPNQNQSSGFSSGPPKQILLRSILLTTLFFILLILLLFFWYSTKHPTYNLLELLEFSVPIGLGIAIGILTIWLVYPQSYGPKYLDEIFPKVSWIFLWYLFLGPLVVVIFSGVSLFNLHNIVMSSDSPLTTNFYHTENVAFLTYFIFFLTLGFSVKRQRANSSTPSLDN